MNFNKPKLITLLAIGLFVLGSGLNNAIAQTAINASTLILGTKADLNLNLILPITVNGKVYYFLDNNADGIASAADAILLQPLRDLLNNGERLTSTQDGNHGGSDDARSVIIRNYTLILPTFNEYVSISQQYHGNVGTEDGTPPGWFRNDFYHTSNRFDPPFLVNRLFDFDITASAGLEKVGNLTVPRVAAFQVIEILEFRIKVFLEGAQ